MKYKTLTIFLIMLLMTSCLNSTLDTPIVERSEGNRTLHSLTTRSVPTIPDDSISIKSKQQSDLDLFMLSRIVQKDGNYVLAIKRQDALFLGVSESMYDFYLNLATEYNNQSKE
ncbi:MAG: hypothetical protein E7134_06425 [Rikenellaceae bacterium]|nr:hypothetical protein [Rikenellaceae bacterium]